MNRLAQRTVLRLSRPEFAPARHFLRCLAGALLCLSLLVISGGCAFGVRGQEVSEDRPTPHPPPVFEIYPDETGFPEAHDRPRGPAVTGSPPALPRVAIIIDDIGYDLAIVDDFLSLNLPLTYSLFPVSPFRKPIERKIRARGREIMLHLPMEPVEYPAIQPGPGALLSEMSPEDMRAQLRQHLDGMAHISGVNNHMGSKVTQMPTVMYQILSVLRQRGLFFIDSYTTPDSICGSSARLLQIPFARRDVFLDHIQDPEAVRRQLSRLIRIARKYGEAIGIGHPHTVTYEVLRELLPVLKKEVRLVPASQVVHTIG